MGMLLRRYHDKAEVEVIEEVQSEDLEVLENAAAIEDVEIVQETLIQEIKEVNEKPKKVR